MDLLGMLGLNRNDIVDAYNLGERAVVALERIAKALEQGGQAAPHHHHRLPSHGAYVSTDIPAPGAKGSR